MAETRQVDQITGVETTGHSWDGITELNNPLPRWWLWTFYATIAFALVYTILYPAWPMVSSATSGLLGWSSRGDLEASVAAAKAADAGRLEKIAALSVEAIDGDQELRPAAIAAGKAAFKVNCVQCHGSGAEGGPGYPNLNDDSWLWGGTLEAIHTTLEHGIRYASDDDTRISEMPAFGRDGILDRGQIDAVADYVLSLSGSAADQQTAAAEAGRTVFAENCAACHGETGGGMKEVGAPALDDAIWLYGGSKADIVRQVTAPRHGVMPAWGARLGETTVKELAVYVHSLGGGQ
ncbi:cytochrome-c oxidase, cbb3-type subunit III [Jiella sonneratiae]|uniref:Cbb3-type cytochrome c oxidase subunit n=1 Tax=Jiella sonneratiae TaxID=2816856 RepID=A0ABS3J2E9_9HYPH|nr:cytochrome-c oxidase, cbb3-type subunit III [Jiella sonneratiae]MBO0903830.1 cytochrome-c oxidase, cbb3-type subunit III [Jiella sonneratiae]